MCCCSEPMQNSSPMENCPFQGVTGRLSESAYPILPVIATTYSTGIITLLPVFLWSLK